eukprot:9865162-Alexandrium_andersonii.AAC.1
MDEARVEPGQPVIRDRLEDLVGQGEAVIAGLALLALLAALSRSLRARLDGAVNGAAPAVSSLIQRAKGATMAQAELDGEAALLE